MLSLFIVRRNILPLGLGLLAPLLFGQFQPVTVKTGSYSGANQALQFVEYQLATPTLPGPPKVVVFIHGGGWHKPGYEYGPIAPPNCDGQNNQATITCGLAELGYTVFSIDYTLVSSETASDLSITSVTGNSTNVRSSLFQGTSNFAGYAVVIPDVPNNANWKVGGYTVLSSGGGTAVLSGVAGANGLSNGMLSLIKQTTQWPIQAQDCNCFLNYLISNLGTVFPGDPNQIFLFGHSSGGQLAGVLGLALKGTFNTGSCAPDPKKYNIAGVIGASAPTDLVSLYTSSSTAKADIYNLLGCVPNYGTCNTTAAASASITYYIQSANAPFPPYISFSGGADTGVLPSNVQEASQQFSSLHPKVLSQWVNMGPSFNHDLDLYQFNPCSADKDVGAEPAPCGSQGGVYQHIEAFVANPGEAYPEPPIATSPISQSVAKGVATNPLQVYVKDANGAPLTGAVVTFAVNPAGDLPAEPAAWGSFGVINSQFLFTAAAITNASGIATAPTLTANSTSGVFHVTASTGGGTLSFTVTIN